MTEVRRFGGQMALVCPTCVRTVLDCRCEPDPPAVQQCPACPHVMHTVGFCTCGCNYPDAPEA